MTPQEFKEIWTKNGGLVSPITSNRLTQMNLNKETAEFLTLSGLPEEAAPFLTFIKDTNDKYNGINYLTTQFDFLEPEYSKFIVIGSDGSGNPIVINTENNNQIEWLDHEDYFSSRYMNSSIVRLTDFLIIYREFIETILAENGENAYLNSDFTDEQFQTLKDKMNDSDSRALTENGFWKEELEMLIANRNENLEGK